MIASETKDGEAHARMLWLKWSGGGNLAPSLGIARALTKRGHTIAFAAPPEMVRSVEAAGFRTIEITQAYAQIDCYPRGHVLTRAACYLTSPAVEAQVKKIVDAEAPDIVLIDAMFLAALAQAPHFGRPSALFVYTFLFRQIDNLRKILRLFDGMRQQAGFAPLPALDDLWRSRERIIATSLGDFDAPPGSGWDMVRHTGPVLEDEQFATPTALPWAENDPTPLVMVSFSTEFEQRDVNKLQRSLDALANLSVHVVATTGGIVAPNELAVPKNAVVLDYVAHNPIMQRAALVLTHGGHGTAMRALRHGVPLIIIPGHAGDQSFVTAAVQEWGAGRALPVDASVDAIRAGAQEVLFTPQYRDNARQRSVALAGVDGAANAANEIESLLRGDRREGSAPRRGKATDRPAE
jgi:UDP:flavonoid glycosyltransferase YjiC (YdhE family)